MTKPVDSCRFAGFRVSLGKGRLNEHQQQNSHAPKNRVGSCESWIAKDTIARKEGSRLDGGVRVDREAPLCLARREGTLTRSAMLDTAVPCTCS